MRIRTLALAAPIAALGMMLGAPARSGEPTSKDQDIVRALAPADMSVEVGPGEVTFPDGRKVAVAKTVLYFAPPEFQEVTVTGTTPRDYADWYDAWDPWPSAQFDPSGTKIPNSLDLSPPRDHQGTLILGGLFRAFDPQSVVVTTPDGSRTFQVDKDYRYNASWGQIANIDGRLGKAGASQITAKAKYAMQRLDLVEVDGSGNASVKEGSPAMVCPALPAPDAGDLGLAGIYIAPWPASLNPWFDGTAGLNAATVYAISQHEIWPIHPAPPVQPINPSAIRKSLAKLATGKELRIAFLGASISVGAESPLWWADLWTPKNLGFPSRVVTALRARFPKATVTPIPAFLGGTTAKYGLEMIDKTVIPGKADLVLLDFGGNDAAGPVGKPPRNPPAQFKEDMRTVIKKARAAGIEVMILVGEAPSPWLKNKSYERWPAYRQAMLELASEEKVAAADISRQVADLATEGIPPFSQLHNGINHPGVLGHELYADVILRFFDRPPAAK